MLRYKMEISHTGLNKYRCLTGSDPDILQERGRAIQLTMGGSMGETR